MFVFLDERFEYARKLKGAMTELRSAGEKLGKLELSKTQAIQNEDYAKAKKKKTQMEEFRTQVLIEQQVDDLLEKNGVSPIRYGDISRVKFSLLKINYLKCKKCTKYSILLIKCSTIEIKILTKK